MKGKFHHHVYAHLSLFFIRSEELTIQAGRRSSASPAPGHLSQFFLFFTNFLLLNNCNWNYSLKFKQKTSFKHSVYTTVTISHMAVCINDILVSFCSVNIKLEIF